MLVCRSRPRRLAAFCSFSARSAASTPQPTTDQAQDSIFTAPGSPWDNIFSDVEPASSDQRRHTEDNMNPPATPGHGKGTAPNARPHGLLRRSSGLKQQRASITAREMSVFDEMFDMIFNAVSARQATSAARTSSSTAVPSSSSGQTPSIGRTAPLGDMFQTLRRRSRVRWTTAIDEELDRKKETMELFNTDHDLLEWVENEVFGEAAKWEAGGSSGERTIYPHLIAHAMRVFRTTYGNPTLSLAVFEHAARMSVASYVFGCTAPAYNELIEARWEGWGDLEGVCGALEEMRANGVKIDGRTRVVTERVRLEVGEARPGQGGTNGLARRAWEVLGEEEVMGLLQRMERLAVRDRSRKKHEETWKLESTSDGSDGWKFDGWEPRRKSAT